jgi:hypothetical protein
MGGSGQPLPLTLRHYEEDIMKIDKVIAGLVRYIDNNMLPSFDDDQQTLYLIACEMATQYPDAVLNLINGNLALRIFLSPDKDGNIDVDRAIKILKATAQRKGKLSMTVPRFGTVAFSAEDFDEIYRHLKEDGRYEIH